MTKPTTIADLEKKIKDLENDALSLSHLSDLEKRLIEIMFFLADRLEIPRSDLDFRRPRS